MKKKFHSSVAQLSLICFLAGFLGVFASLSSTALADEEANKGVAGCTAVKVDPSASLEDQQAVCGHAEASLESSCEMSGHGKCSSPKTNGTMVEADHCICLSEEVPLTDTAPEPAPVS